MKQFCTVPWLQQDIKNKSVVDYDKFCCWTVSGTKRKELQEKFRAGEKPIECKKCWDAEARGDESRREMENGFFDYIFDLDMLNIRELVLAGKLGVASYQITLSSVCNGACTTCDSGSSSTWIKYDKKMNKVLPIAYPAHSTEFLDTAIDFKTVKSLRLLGGEPFLSNSTFWIFNQLLENGNSDCFVSIITNGTIKIPDKFLSILAKFNKLNICISIDAIEKEFNYIRFPLKWDILTQRLKEYRKVCDDISISFTVSNLNIHSMDNTIKWFDEQKLPYIMNYVRYPKYFASEVQPGHSRWQDFVNTINEQDEAKGISIKDYIPEVWEQINSSNYKTRNPG